MNTDDLHNFLKLKDTVMFKTFEDFITASDKNGKYKLFHVYLFRTDSLLDSIKNNSYLFWEKSDDYLKNGKINYRNRQVKRYVDDNGSLYIGNVYSEKYGFRPFFISYRRSTSYNRKMKVSDIFGFSLNAGIESDSIYFDESTTKCIRRISEKEMNAPIWWASDDLKSSITEMMKRTRENLKYV